MDKNLEFYNNRNIYGNACVPPRERVFDYLIKDNFLSEFSTEEEKLQALENLGISQELDFLLKLLNNKIESSTLNGYVTKAEFFEELAKLRTKSTESSKGYYSSYEELILRNPVNYSGDWAIVNENGVWYIYKYSDNGWERDSIYAFKFDLSEYIKLSDINLLLDTLISAINFKTINGESILGTGNIQIKSSSLGSNVDLTDYIKYDDVVIQVLNENIQSLQNSERTLLLNNLSITENLNLTNFRVDSVEQSVSGISLSLSLAAERITNLNNDLQNEISRSNRIEQSLLSVIDNFLSLVDVGFIREINLKVDDEIIRSQTVDTQLTSRINNLESLSMKHIFLTQEEYDALEEYERDVLYFIVSETTEEPILEGEASLFGDTFPFKLA